MPQTTIDFGDTITDWMDVSDIQFLEALSWKKDAASDLPVIAVESDLDAFADSLKRQLRSSASRVGKEGVASWPSSWSHGAFAETERTDELLELLEQLQPKTKREKVSHMATHRSGQTALKKPSEKKLKQSQDQLDRWLGQIDSKTPISPFELVVLFDLLEIVGTELESALLCRLWRAVLSGSINLTFDLEESDLFTTPEDEKVLILGEIPYRAGLLFSDIKKSKKLRQRGEEFLEQKLLSQTDTDGTPHAELLPRLPYWLAPIVRSLMAAKTHGRTLWNEETDVRFDYTLETIVSLCQPDGRILLSNASAHHLVTMLQTASKLVGWKKNLAPANYLNAVGNGSKRSAEQKPPKLKKDDYPVTQSDWAQLACLRNNWSIDSDSLVIAHHCSKPQIDLTGFGKPLLSGEWGLEIKIDGNFVELGDDWTCVCWFSDEDSDFLELQMTLDNGIRIERQALLARDRNFVMLADSVTGAGNKKVEYTSRLPLFAGVTPNMDTRTRECLLTAKQQVARVFPLALPQDKVLSTAGEFSAEGDSLVLKQVADGDGLFAPIVIDWGPRRRKKTAVWRTLTVSESRKTVRGDVAAGHRLKIGNHHILIYRSLKPPEEARAVLGHHTFHETMIGTFDREGEVSPILLVE